ncbi:MAG: hypothetical protein QXI77_00880 [Nanopusillaceae archaeon]
MDIISLIVALTYLKIVDFLTNMYIGGIDFPYILGFYIGFLAIALIIISSSYHYYVKKQFDVANRVILAISLVAMVNLTIFYDIILAKFVPELYVAIVLILLTFLFVPFVFIFRDHYTIFFSVVFIAMVGNYVNSVLFSKLGFMYDCNFVICVPITQITILIFSIIISAYLAFFVYQNLNIFVTKIRLIATFISFLLNVLVLYYLASFVGFLDIYTTILLLSILHFFLLKIGFENFIEYENRRK